MYPGEYYRCDAADPSSTMTFTADCVLSFEGIEHVKDPSILIDNMYLMSQRMILLSWPDNWGPNVERGGFHLHNMNIDVVKALIKDKFEIFPVNGEMFTVMDRQGNFFPESKLMEIQDPCVLMAAKKLR